MDTKEEAKLLSDLMAKRPSSSETATGEWKTIESAPKDESRYLVYVPREPTPDNSTTFDIYEVTYVGGYDSGDIWFSKGSMIYHPTHWMRSPKVAADQEIDYTDQRNLG